MHLLSLNIYNCFYLLSCKALLTNCCSSVAPPASISFRYLRAKLNFLKIYCIFYYQGKKHKRIQFSVVFALFMFKKALLCSFYV